MGVHFAFSVHRDVHFIEKPTKKWDFSQFSLTHGMEVHRYTYIYEHYVEVGSMVRTEDEGLTLLWLEIAVNFIENESRPKDKMGPNLFQFKNQGEPFLAKQ